MNGLTPAEAGRIQSTMGLAPGDTVTVFTAHGPTTTGTVAGVVWAKDVGPIAVVLTRRADDGTTTIPWHAIQTVQKVTDP